MSYCQREVSGKDKSVFLTQEDEEKTELVSDLVTEESYGIVLPSGDINWDCPCLGGLPKGTCGEDFKAAFSCFHYSEEEEKGIDCIPQFQAMQSCFQKHPEEYAEYSDDEEEKGQGKDTPAEESSAASTPKQSDDDKSSSSESSSSQSSPPQSIATPA